jgi:hypothetical protein
VSCRAALGGSGGLGLGRSPRSSRGGGWSTEGQVEERSRGGGGRKDSLGPGRAVSDLFPLSRCCSSARTRSVPQQGEEDGRSHQ